LFFEEQTSLRIVIPPMTIPGIDESQTESGEGINENALNEETEEGIDVETVNENEAKDDAARNDSAEVKYYDSMKGLGENVEEYKCVSGGLTKYRIIGAGLGCRSVNMQELGHIMKYKEVMRTAGKPH
jgi:hypothetical protein